MSIVDLGVFAPSLDGLLFTIINVTILYFILRKILYKPVTQFLESRRNKIAEDMQSAESQEELASNLRKTYEIKLQEIHKEADEILENARKSASLMEDHLIQEARQKAQNIIERASKEVEQEQERARAQIREDIIEIASQLAGTFVAVSLDDIGKKKITDDFIKEVGETQWLL